MGVISHHMDCPHIQSEGDYTRPRDILAISVHPLTPNHLCLSHMQNTYTSSKASQGPYPLFKASVQSPKHHHLNQVLMRLLGIINWGTIPSSLWIHETKETSYLSLHSQQT